MLFNERFDYPRISGTHLFFSQLTNPVSREDLHGSFRAILKVKKNSMCRALASASGFLCLFVLLFVCLLFFLYSAHNVHFFTLNYWTKLSG